MKKNHVIALIAGASAAAVAVLSVGGYLLHKKMLKNRLQEQVRLQELEDFEDYEDFDDEDEDSGEDYNDDFYKGMLGDYDGEFDEDGFYKTANIPVPAPLSTSAVEQEDGDR